jgi:hypothetical protein
MAEIRSDLPGTTDGVEVVECDYVPPCPHCKEPLRRILKCVSSGSVQTETIYSCSECGQLLSIGYDRAS